MLAKEQLHEYQRYCIEFIKKNPAVLLILEMGLGKTIISLTAIEELMFESFEVNKVLIIAPLRVARDVWPEEIRGWSHVKDLRCSVILGKKEARTEALNADADIYIINRENLQWLVEELEKSHTPWPFDMAVIDELSSFKNCRSKRYRALNKVRPFISRIVGLTGTPSSNGLMDLWSEVRLIDGGKRLGKYIGRFREQYFKVGDMNPYTGEVYNYIPLPGAEKEIYKKIGDITVSMKSLDYLEMPECINIRHEVEMNGKERKLYNSLKNNMILQLGGNNICAENAAVLSGKLQQMANGAIYDENKEIINIHERKLDMLEDLVEQSNGQSVLIAYWYQHDRTRIAERLKKAGYEPRELRSEQDILDWNSGRIQTALISPASAGHGLNIQKGGHILVWFSTIWSLEMFQQTNARLWRQGQKDIVTIHHIICKDTIDEDVLDALENKDTTQKRLIDAVKADLEVQK